MMMKKAALLFLSLILLLSLCACGEAPSSEQQPEEKPETDTTDTADTEIATDAVAVVNGRKVTQDDSSYFVQSYADYLTDTVGEIEDWNADNGEGKTYGEQAKESALEWFVYAGALTQQASRLNLELTEEDRSVLEEEWQDFLNNFESEEAAQAALEASGCSEELYRYILEIQYLNELVFDQMYGENGQNLSDEDCATLTEGEGYIMAKHILVLTTATDEDGNSTELPEEEKAEKLEIMKEIKARLDESPEEEKEALFDELMNEYSEDTGLASYPGGYLFQEGDMVTEFYDAAVALEEGDISDIVQTVYGYHLIRRIAVDYDVIPSAYSAYAAYGYDYLTLRFLCADEAFAESTDRWMERVEVETTDLFESLSVQDLVAVG